eukprot:scaffold62586_cov72-Phaeocystis_antarctica.AAC.2
MPLRRDRTAAPTRALAPQHPPGGGAGRRACHRLVVHDGRGLSAADDDVVAVSVGRGLHEPVDVANAALAIFEPSGGRGCTVLLNPTLTCRRLANTALVLRRPRYHN